MEIAPKSNPRVVWGALGHAWKAIERIVVKAFVGEEIFNCRQMSRLIVKLDESGVELHKASQALPKKKIGSFFFKTSLSQVLFIY